MRQAVFLPDTVHGGPRRELPEKGRACGGQGRAPNRVPAGLQAVAPLRKVIFFVQPGAVVKKIPIFAAQIVTAGCGFADGSVAQLDRAAAF